MSKIVNVLIKDKNTLIINQDAKKGDEIDLSLLNSIDLTNIEKQINQGLDDVYTRKLQEREKEWKNLQEVAVEQAKLTATMELQNKIATLEVKMSSQEEVLKSKYEQAALEKQNELQNRINNLENNMEVVKKEILLEKEKEFLTKEEHYKQIINTLQEEKNRLTLEKSMINVKKIGERLEHWCANEFEQFSLNGFVNCTFEKDNKSVKEDDETKGTKADYIFKVYATSDKNENEILTSVACEMKSEDPTSTNKKKNSDHYKKLDADRRKKNCEYALLISELEWNDANDVPIRKVKDYEKMYVVRPQYFITFLNIVTNLAKKYQELLLEKAKERILFKESDDLLREFEELKINAFDKPLLKLEKEVSELSKQRQIISDAAEKMGVSINKITDNILVDIRKKIDNFNITKINKKITKLEE